ncbi:hypothetical protein GCM10027423_50310 [Spirosoma arcticum]
MTALHQQIRVARHDTTRIVLLEKLSIAYLNKNKPDSALRFLQQALRLANQSRQPLNLGRVYRGFGKYYHHRQLTIQRINAYQKAALFFQQARRVPEAARAMFDVAKGYASHFEQAKAVEQCNKNLAYAQQTGYDELVSLSYALLYTIHTNFGDKKKAFADLIAMQKAAERYPTLENKYLANGNLAEWYDNQHDYAKALPYWQITLSVLQKMGKPLEVAEAYTSIATDFIKLSQFEKAEGSLNKGFRAIDKSPLVSANIYLTLARLREGQNRLSEAHQAVLVALTNARKTFQPFITKSSLETLLRIQEKQTKYRQAVITSHQLTALNDSINEAKHIQTIALVESRFNFQKKEEDLILLRQNAIIQMLEMERTQKQKILYSSIAIGLSVLLLLMGWIVVQDRRNLLKLNGQKAEITAQAQKLSELNTVKDKLFSLIGHDLRAPVLSLKFNVDLLDQKQQSEEWLGQHARQLKRTVNSLYHTVDNLLHWAALQKEGMHTRPEAVSLLDLVIETKELFELTIVQKNIAVDIGRGNAIAWADDGQAQIVIRNIIHNALKFTPSGGHINISFDQSATHAVVRIADTGIGIATVYPQQAAQTPNRVGTQGETSLGLGLLVCHEFMKRNGGRLEIKSTVGEGTVVSLLFKSGCPVHIT